MRRDLRPLRQPLDDPLHFLLTVQQHAVVGRALDEPAIPFDVRSDKPQEVVFGRAKADHRVDRQDQPHGDE